MHIQQGKINTLGGKIKVSKYLKKPHKVINRCCETYTSIPHTCFLVLRKIVIDPTENYF